MKRDYIDFQDRSSPVGFLITFRCYGTWLHGFERIEGQRYARYERSWCVDERTKSVGISGEQEIPLGRRAAS